MVKEMVKKTVKKKVWGGGRPLSERERKGGGHGRPRGADRSPPPSRVDIPVPSQRPFPWTPPIWNPLSPPPAPPPVPIQVKAMKEYEKVALKPVELTLQTLLEVNTADAGVGARQTDGRTGGRPGGGVGGSMIKDHQCGRPEVPNPLPLPRAQRPSQRCIALHAGVPP